MKNKLLIICAIILFSLTSACSCSNKKSVDDKKIQKIGVFEVKETKTENVDGSLKLNISLKNTSEKTEKVPLFYISLINKDNLKIVDIENPGGQKVDKNMSTNFEINTDVQYSTVTKIKYKTTK
ncbi:MAG: hypothetical protein V8Q71_02060 [Bacilli bacterium]